MPDWICRCPTVSALRPVSPATCTRLNWRCSTTLELDIRHFATDVRFHHAHKVFSVPDVRRTFVNHYCWAHLVLQLQPSAEPARRRGPRRVPPARRTRPSLFFNFTSCWRTALVRRQRRQRRRGRSTTSDQLLHIGRNGQPFGTGSWLQENRGRREPDDQRLCSSWPFKATIRAGTSSSAAP
jgi:hypothetical protein